MHIWHRSRQRGSALLTALFIMTLVAIAATAMTLRLKVDIAKMQIAIEANSLKSKAYLPTFMGMQWLLQAHLPEARQKQNPVILTRFPKLTNETNWQISGEIIDLQSRLNLNNLENKKNHKAIQKLLINLGIDQSAAKKIVKLCHYWILPYRLGRGNDSLLNQFLSQKPPYYPGFQPFISPSEIRLIPGVDRKIANKIMPFIISLPNTTPINITTAPPEIIKILGDGLTDSQVNRILELRSSGQIYDKKKLDALLKQYNIPTNQVTLQSDYFLILSNVKHLDNHIQQFTIVERKQSKTKKKVKLNTIFMSYHTL